MDLSRFLRKSDLKTKLSIKGRLVLSNWLISFLICSVLGLVAITWFAQDLKSRMDNFLISESRLIKASVEIAFRPDGLGTTGYDMHSLTFKSFLAQFFFERNNRPLPYKTTLAVYDSLGKLVSETNSALDFDGLDAPTTYSLDNPNPKTIGGYSAYRFLDTPLIQGATLLGFIRLACPTSSLSEPLTSFNEAILLVLFSTLLVFGLVGTWLTKSALRPIRTMTVSAKKISETTMSSRIPVPPGHDELTELSLTLNQLLDRLEKDFTFQESLLSQLTHELRTPLTILRGKNEVVLKRETEIDGFRVLTADNLERIDNIVTLLNRLLSLARVESGVDKLEIRRTDLRLLLSELLEELEPLWEEKKIDFDLELPSESKNWNECPPLYAKVDPLRFKQAVTNVLTNAYKYAPFGSTIRIRMATTRGDAAGRPFWAVVIANGGPPIPEAALELIFKRFYRVENSFEFESNETEPIHGFGLGLAIARSLLNLQNCAIRAFSPPEGGAAFEVLAPKDQTA